MFRFLTKLKISWNSCSRETLLPMKPLLLYLLLYLFTPISGMGVFVVQPFMSTSNVELSNPVFSMCEYFFLLAFCLYFKTLSKVVLRFSKYDLTEP